MSALVPAGMRVGVLIPTRGVVMESVRRPDVEFYLVQPESKVSPLVGPSMGFESSRAALRYGHTSVTEWLVGEGAPFAARFR